MSAIRATHSIRGLRDQGPAKALARALATVLGVPHTAVEVEPVIGGAVGLPAGGSGCLVIASPGGSMAFGKLRRLRVRGFWGPVLVLFDGCPAESSVGALAAPLRLPEAIDTVCRLEPVPERERRSVRSTARAVGAIVDRLVTTASAIIAEGRGGGGLLDEVSKVVSWAPRAAHVVVETGGVRRRLDEVLLSSATTLDHGGPASTRGAFEVFRVGFERWSTVVVESGEAAEVARRGRGR